MATELLERPTVRELAVERAEGLDIGEVARFTAAVALLAILADATVGHALAWENDPYWTYWITKTFLIATVFGLGTAWAGTGAGRGAVITAAHTVVLTVYYWSLSPIGLPSSPDWLDLEHTWVTGVPIHFGVVYLGYLGALWLWRRRPLVGIDRAEGPPPATRAVEVLVVAAVAVGVMGAVEAVALDELQGITWYVVRLLIVAPFLLVWQGVAGRDGRAAIGGAVVLTAMITAYTHFLGPVGLPDLPMRIFERAAPGATAHWLDYRQEALVVMPVTLVVALTALAVLTHPGGASRRLGAGGMLAVAIGALLVAGVGAAVAPRVGPDSAHAAVDALGAARIERGAFFGGTTADGTATMSLTAIDRNPRVTPLPPNDTVALQAVVVHPDGHTYTVIADQPMVEDPLGRYTTWWGVGLDVWHHGRSGIGTSQLPATHSPVALFAVGEVDRDGTPIATGVPVHAMTMDDGSAELDVGDPAMPMPGVPDQHLRVVWDHATVAVHDAKAAHYAFGGAVLVGLLLLAAAGLHGTRSTDVILVS